MNDRLPWPAGTATAVLALVGGLWLLAIAVLMLGPSLGWLVMALAAWLSAGLVYTALRGQTSAE